MKSGLFVPDPSFELWTLLVQVRNALYKVRDRELRRLGISPMQARILFLIQLSKGGITPAEISRQTLREPNTISVILKNMDRRGLVKLTKNFKRKNMIKVTITNKGRSINAQSIKIGAIQEAMSALSEEERQQLYEILEKLFEKALRQLGINVAAGLGEFGHYRRGE